ncbi:MAG: histidine kinase [Chitinophagaceae bacterium]|nr:histidine kinase [Chitinophagaceae bacterium]
MQNAAFFTRYKLHHLLIWLLVLGAWFFLRVDDYPSEGMAFRVTLIKVADLAILIYLTNLVLIPYLLYKKRYVLFALLFLGIIFASSILKMSVLGNMLDKPELINWRSDFKRRLYDNIIPHFFLVVAGVAAKLVYDYSRLQQRMAETAREKAEAELNFLKSQINPHFVFNSLNAVYFLINKENNDARNALHRFSEMLRYQLYEMNGEKVPIEKEVHYLQDYIHLQQLRKDEHYTAEFTCSPMVKGFSIEPLLLIPLVENAFKHISHHSGQVNFVKVNMDRQNGSFVFLVENSTDDNRIKSESGGIGLVNIKRRLELLYPGRHELTIQQDNGSFRASLNIHLYEN